AAACERALGGLDTGADRAGRRGLRRAWAGQGAARAAAHDRCGRDELERRGPGQPERDACSTRGSGEERMTVTNVQPAQGSAPELSQQVGFVTGGATGIGLAVSKALAARGAAVAIFARNATRAEAAAEAIRKSGAQARAYGADISSADSVDRAFDEAVKQLG